MKVNLKPELVGELLALLAEAVELGVDATWLRPRLENAASNVVETASGREYLDTFVDLAVLANCHDLLSAADVDDVRIWAEEARRPVPMPRLSPAQQRERWDEARAGLQWLDSLDFAAKKKLLGLVEDPAGLGLGAGSAEHPLPQCAGQCGGTQLALDVTR